MTREESPKDVPKEGPRETEACPDVLRSASRAHNTPDQIRQEEMESLEGRLTRKNRELAAANAELRRLDETRTAFISTAAHELRSPLASISGYVEMLLAEDFGPLNEAQRERLEIVQRSANRLLHTTDTLLDLTRIEGGRIELTLQPRDLAALVEAAIAEFGPQMEAKDQRLVWQAAPDLPGALCDEERAEQIIDNLLSNASKYTSSGGQITVSLAPAEMKGFLELSVTDTGVGIPAEDQNRLFSRFFRGEGAQRMGARGTGLGLYITKALVQLHGGRIWFESARDEGSTFHVTFPVATQG